MSHQETSRLEFANACRQMLDEAEHRLDGILKDCDAVERGSSSLIDADTESMMEGIRSAVADMRRTVSDRRSSIGSRAYADEVESTRSVLSDVNSLHLRSMALRDAINRVYDARISGRASNDARIDGIGDAGVRTMARLLSRNPAHADMPFEDLVSLAESRVDPARRVDRSLAAPAVEEARRMMEAERIPRETVESVIGDGETSPLEIMDAATSEVMDERLRRSAIAAIVRSLTSRGFLVDRSNIRHIRETDTVKLVASKPGGQTAEFSIDLQGRFMYHFQGYEGSACEKDIGPLERDLEEVYGIRMVDRVTVWRNPDRNTTMHHMEAKVRRDSRCR